MLEKGCCGIHHMEIILWWAAEQHINQVQIFLVSCYSRSTTLIKYIPFQIPSKKGKPEDTKIAP
jgi:hypothetical protein